MMNKNRLVRPQGLEPWTPTLKVWYSNQLSYGRACCLHIYYTTRSAEIQIKLALIRVFGIDIVSFH